MKQAPFEELKTLLQKMTPDYRAKLLHAHQEFTRLKAGCAAKGYIELLSQMRGIRVLKMTPEVRELKAAIDFLKPAKFIWEDKNEIQPIPPKARKTARPKTKTG
jgi:hypothetical protein